MSETGQTKRAFLERVLKEIATDGNHDGNEPLGEVCRVGISLADLLTERTAELTRIQQANAALVGALTPSAETKTAFLGEFHFDEEFTDEDGQWASRRIYVPWTTVKEIMKAISDRAALASQ